MIAARCSARLQLYLASNRPSFLQPRLRSALYNTSSAARVCGLTKTWLSQQPDFPACHQDSVPIKTNEDKAVGQADSPNEIVLSDIRVVLVSPKTASNVGAVARCCGNFEVGELYVVAPRCDPYDSEVYRVACTDGVVGKIKVVESLEVALMGTSGSLGFTRRAGGARITHSSMAQLLASFPSAMPNMVPAGRTGTAGVTALVFGREESGLTESEVRLCSHACAIPTGRLQPSLNLSHAVSVVLAQCFDMRSIMNELSHGQSTAGIIEAVLKPASFEEVELLVKKSAAIAEAVGLSGAEHAGGTTHGRKRLPIGHIRALFQRAKITSKYHLQSWKVWVLPQEARSLHGLATAVLAALAPMHPLVAKLHHGKLQDQSERGASSD